MIAAFGIRFLGTNVTDGASQTVAVLPLRDVSPDGTQVALAAGLTEAIIADLGRIAGRAGIGPAED